MLKILKLKYKLLTLTNDEKEKEKLKLEIYSTILGYYTCKKDRSFTNMFNDNDIINELENKIKNIFKTNYRIIGIKDNSYDSFKVFLNNAQNDNNIELCELAKLNFNEGYNHYIELYNNISIMDILITNKPARIENNFIKILKKS